MTDPYAIQPSELDQLPDRDPEETAEWQASWTPSRRLLARTAPRT